MASNYTVGQLKTDLENSLHGTTLNKVQGVNQMIQRAASTLLLDVDPLETIRLVTLATPIFNSVYDYALPNDLKGTKVIDIRPQANRTLLDRYVQGYNQDFDVAKSYTLQPNFTINYANGIKTIRIDNNLLPIGAVLNQANTISGDGLWTTGGNANNLTQDNLNFVVGASSLSFNISASGSTAFLVNSTNPPLNLSNQINQSNIFFYTYLPTGSDFTSIEIQWGSSSSNYWTQTMTGTQEGTVFQNGWNLIDAEWKTATQVGSPDVTNITYLKVIWNYNGTQQTAVRLNGIDSQLGAISQIEYYSKFIFRDSITGLFQEYITDDSNLINLDTETRNLLYLLSGFYMAQQVQGLDGMFFDSNWYQQNYQKALAEYRAQFKSQWQKPRSTYYGLPNPSNKQWFNGNRYNY